METSKGQVILPAAIRTGNEWKAVVEFAVEDTGDGGAATAQAFCVFAPNADAELSDIPKEPLMFEQQSACRLPEGSSESALLWSLRFWHRRAR